MRSFTIDTPATIEEVLEEAESTRAAEAEDAIDSAGNERGGSSCGVTGPVVASLRQLLPEH